LKREAEYPLAHGLFRQHLIDQQGGTLRHAPRPATGAEAAPLAAEGHKVFGMAGLATYPQKAVLPGDRI